MNLRELQLAGGWENLSSVERYLALALPDIEKKYREIWG